jgi:hypothetical protein
MPAVEEMQDILDEHLPYEVKMLFVTHDALYPPGRLVGGDLNVVLESFCIHARNLIEMFTRKRGERYVLATDYIPSYSAFQGCQSEISDLYKKICEQISHLTYDRKRDPADKIQTDKHVPRARQLLEAEIKAFVRGLPVADKQVWDGAAAKAGLSQYDL